MLDIYARQPSGVPQRNVIQRGTPRSDVITELGLPERSVQDNGKRTDTYKLDPNAQTHGAKVAMTSMHFIADAATLGLWEVVGTPVELASGEHLTTYVITYSPRIRLRT